MSRVFPLPPDGLVLSPVPNMSLDQAVAWFRTELGVELTPRYLRESVTRGDLACSLVAGKRRTSPKACWEFILSRPAKKKPRRRVSA